LFNCHPSNPLTIVSLKKRAVQAMSTTTTPLQTVLNTPELLTQILLCLPLRSLLHAQRISHHWRDLILHSPSLQSALYFRPLPSACCPSLPVHNPLLASTFAPWFIDLRLLDPSGVWPFCKAFPQLPWTQAPEAFRRADASWRDMLVVQPPARTLVVERRIEDRGADLRTRWMYKLGERGLRMGLFYDFVEEWCSWSEDKVGGVRWEMCANSEGGTREGVKSEWDDCVTIILHHPEKPFLLSYEDGANKKPKDFGQFRSLGAVDLGKLEFESTEYIFVTY
jgi:hypothetical protein